MSDTKDDRSFPPAGDELRCIAHEIIIRLMEEKNLSALELLHSHCGVAVSKLRKDSSGKGHQTP